ncbi:hypothetical protein [Haloferula sp. A504]|uniref:hypothetical protein n=1 Tax=Haloferula sp. A504 TaxID=3373601 RepID=UPI0031C57152|nr:hypothetical protein [Verrucomicrobiaceae bacterium E54]
MRPKKEVNKYRKDYDALWTFTSSPEGFIEPPEYLKSVESKIGGGHNPETILDSFLSNAAVFAAALRQRGGIQLRFNEYGATIYFPSRHKDCDHGMVFVAIPMDEVIKETVADAKETGWFGMGPEAEPAGELDDFYRQLRPHLAALGENPSGEDSTNPHKEPPAVEHQAEPQNLGSEEAVCKCFGASKTVGIPDLTLYTIDRDGIPPRRVLRTDSELFISARDLEALLGGEQDAMEFIRPADCLRLPTEATIQHSGDSSPERLERDYIALPTAIKLLRNHQLLDAANSLEVFDGHFI